MTKRIYAALLCLTLIISCLPVTGWASEEEAPAAETAPVTQEAPAPEPAPEPEPEPVPEPTPEPAPEPEPDPEPEPEPSPETADPPAETTPEIPAENGEQPAATETPAAGTPEGEPNAEETPSAPQSGNTDRGTSAHSGTGGVMIYAPDSRDEAAARYEMSEDYMETKYYTALTEAGLTGDQRRDIVTIALTQVGYYDRGKNETEYNRYTGTQGFAWCASFISWCAGQAGISTAIVPAASGAEVGSFGTVWRYRPGSVRPGDIVCFDYGRHVGLVYDTDDEHIYTVEGNYADQVCLRTYGVGDGSLSYYYSPAYENAWYEDEDGGLHYRDVNTGEEALGWLSLGSNTYYLDESGAAVSGFRVIDGESYYFEGEPGLVQYEWVEREDGWSFFDPEAGGAMCTGWYVTDQLSCFFDDNGILVTGRELVDGQVRLYTADPTETVSAEIFIEAGSIDTL